jgi:hypothetical protein
VFAGMVLLARHEQDEPYGDGTEPKHASLG